MRTEPNRFSLLFIIALGMLLGPRSGKGEQPSDEIAPWVAIQKNQDAIRSVHATLRIRRRSEEALLVEQEAAKWSEESIELWIDQDYFRIQSEKAGENDESRIDVITRCGNVIRERTGNDYFERTYADPAEAEFDLRFQDRYLDFRLLGLLPFSNEELIPSSRIGLRKDLQACPKQSGSEQDNSEKTGAGEGGNILFHLQAGRMGWQKLEFLCSHSNGGQPLRVRSIHEGKTDAEVSCSWVDHQGVWIPSKLEWKTLSQGKLLAKQQMEITLHELNRPIPEWFFSWKTLAREGQEISRSLFLKGRRERTSPDRSQWNGAAIVPIVTVVTNHVENLPIWHLNGKEGDANLLATFLREEAKQRRNRTMRIQLAPNRRALVVSGIESDHQEVRKWLLAFSANSTIVLPEKEPRSEEDPDYELVPYDIRDLPVWRKKDGTMDAKILIALLQHRVGLTNWNGETLIHPTREKYLMIRQTKEQHEVIQKCLNELRMP